MHVQETRSQFTLEYIWKPIWKIRVSAPMKMTLGQLRAVGKISPHARELKFEFELSLNINQQFMCSNSSNIESRFQGLSSKFECECIQIDLIQISLHSVGKLVDLTTNITTWGRR